MSTTTEVEKVTCPKCHRTVNIWKSCEHGRRFECCGLWGYNGAPLVDRDTHIARIQAHLKFDRLWKRESLTRPQAYAALSEELGIEPALCHIAQFDAPTCLRVITAVPRIRAKLGLPDLSA